MTERLWPTMSCISRATRVRSAAAASRLRWSRSISSRAARSRSPASWARRIRTVEAERERPRSPCDGRKNSASQTGHRGRQPHRDQHQPRPWSAQAHGSCRSRPCSARLYRATSSGDVGAQPEPSDHWSDEDRDDGARRPTTGLRRRHSSGSTSAGLQQRASPAGQRSKSSANRRGRRRPGASPTGRAGRTCRKTSSTTAVSSTHGAPVRTAAAAAGEAAHRAEPTGAQRSAIARCAGHPGGHERHLPWCGRQASAAHEPVGGAAQGERRPAEQDQQPGARRQGWRRGSGRTSTRPRCSAGRG